MVSLVLALHAYSFSKHNPRSPLSREYHYHGEMMILTLYHNDYNVNHNSVYDATDMHVLASFTIFV